MEKSVNIGDQISVQSEFLIHVFMSDSDTAESQLYSDSKIMKLLQKLTEIGHFQIHTVKIKR